MTDEYTGPLPEATPETRPFWDALRAHKLRVPFCRAGCGAFFYPRAFCPSCYSDDVEWRDCSGRGTLLTFVIPQRASRHFPTQPPFVIGMVELEEGPRLLSRLVDVDPTPEGVRCDMPLEIVFDDVTDEVTLPLFRPREAP